MSLCCSHNTLHHLSCAGVKDDEVVIMDGVEADSKFEEPDELDLSKERVFDVEEAETEGRGYTIFTDEGKIVKP